MIGRVVAIAVLAVLGIGVGTSSAHEQIRIIGIVKGVQPSKLMVKTQEGDTIPIALDNKTVIKRDQKVAAVSDLKIGQTVVIDAFGDDDTNWLALELRIVPAIRRPAPQAESRK